MKTYNNENTSGYSEEQLEQLNERFEEALLLAENTYADDPWKVQDVKKYLQQKILADYDSELASK